MVVVAVAALLIVRQVTSDSGWTGVVIDVSGCPSDAHGCRAFVIPASDQQMTPPPTVAYVDWSGSAATNLDVRIPAGSYAVALEGCSGYETPYTAFMVTSGTHVSVDIGDGYWETPMFLGRTCPGFHGVVPAPSNN